MYVHPALNLNICVILYTFCAAYAYLAVGELIN